MQIDKIKDNLIKLYQKSLYALDCDVDKHPIRIIESCKSLIGIDRSLPNKKLLDFSMDYCEKFTLEEIIFDTTKLNTPMVVTFLDLELSLLDDDKMSSFNNAYYLTKVSDGRQVLEFLLEFSIKYGTNSFLLIWSILRMEMFSGLKNVLPAILVCIRYLILDTKKRKKISKQSLDDILKKYTVQIKDLDIFLNLYRLNNEDLIRKSKINPYICSLLKDNCEIEKNLQKGNALENQLNNGRMWISHYLNDLDFKEYNVGMLLNLDAFRGCFKISTSVNEEKILWSYLNKSL